MLIEKLKSKLSPGDAVLIFKENLTTELLLPELPADDEPAPLNAVLATGIRLALLTDEAFGTDIVTGLEHFASHGRIKEICGVNDNE